MSAAGILFTDGKHILLLKRDKMSDYADHWGIPGGKAKKGELPLDNAIRESKEECGSVEGTRFGHFREKDGSHIFDTYLYAISEPFDVKLSKEHTDYKWASLEEIEDLKLHPKFKEALPSYLRSIKKKFKNLSFKEWLSSI